MSEEGFLPLSFKISAVERFRGMASLRNITHSKLLWEMMNYYDKDRED